jgi:RimJ/RimL family protein N-acetyltransferase
MWHFASRRRHRQATVGFTIASAYWRNGYATEAMTALLDYLFEDVDLHRVVADCDTENIGSWKTLEKLGFRREAHFVESLLIGGQHQRIHVSGGRERVITMACLQREWRARGIVPNEFLNNLSV